MSIENKVYQQVTDRIIEELEKGAAPWIKPWKAGSNEDQNIVSKKGYNGINRLILGMSGFAAPYWGSFKQWQALGGNVRKGEKGTMIVFYSPIVKDAINPSTGDSERSMYHCLKSYYVFNISQVDDIDYEQPAPILPNFNPIPALEDRILKTGANIKHNGSQAFYRPSDDSITMPAKNTFISEDHYYATVLHEITHWSGAKHRLDRTKGKRFADTAYAFEELVAEMGAAFLCQDHGIQGDLRHADYIGSWLKCLKDDNKAIFNAAALAQKAATYINGLDALTNQAAA
jgi:antirestriction protein ArdC